MHLCFSVYYSLMNFEFTECTFWVTSKHYSVLMYIWILWYGCDLKTLWMWSENISPYLGTPILAQYLGILSPRTLRKTFEASCFFASIPGVWLPWNNCAHYLHNIFSIITLQWCRSIYLGIISSLSSSSKQQFSPNVNISRHSDKKNIAICWRCAPIPICKLAAGVSNILYFFFI